MVMMMMMFQLRPHIHILQYQYHHPSTTPKSAYNINNISKCRRREAAALSLSLSLLLFPSSSSSSSSSSAVASTSASKSSSSSSELLFLDIPNSGGVKVLDLRVGSGDVPLHGNQVAIHYYGRLAAKQGWRFDSTYDHKDENGESVPFVFVLGSGKVISGIEAAVKSMKVGGIRRVIIPPSQGYQNTSQEPIPPNFFDRQRLFTTIFNPTRLANGEGSTLGTLIFDIELVAIHYYGRLAAKQGWRFDSTYDHKDENGESVPFVFVLGSGKVISGIEAAVKSMKVGGIRRVIIPPSQGYQNTSQEPIPPNFFDRQRLFTTIFNPTRLANGEGSTLGTLIFDIELVSVRHQ